MDQYGALNRKAWPGIVEYGGKDTYAEKGRLV